MFTLHQEKLFELDQAQNQEFLYDLVYEIIKENPALKLNGQFNELVKPVQKLIDKYLKKGINQINTLKYMVKSHVYLGINYENDPHFAWIKTEMEGFNIEDQLTYVDAFYDLLEGYKRKVVGKDFSFFIEAIDRLVMVTSDIKRLDLLEKIYPKKTNYLNSIDNLNLDVSRLLSDKIYCEEFVLGFDFKNNIFIKNIYGLEV